MSYLVILAVFFVGFLFGVFLMSLMVASRRDDLQRWEDEIAFTPEGDWTRRGPYDWREEGL
jgi:uncharacterized membrane protein SpoIIM required for sporulation